MSSDELTSLLQDILSGGDHFLAGLQKSSPSTATLLAAVVAWAQKMNRSLEEIVAVIEPCIRQSILMSLIPAEAFDPKYTGSIDLVIDRHLAQLAITLGHKERLTIRDICINAAKLKGMDKKAARNQSMSLAELRGRPTQYKTISDRQNGRCLWCGVVLDTQNVKITLEHIAPKHLGDDPIDGRNWGLACASCNSGKAETLAWAAQAQAHDFFGRIDFETPNQIPLAGRWAVLMRSRACINCGTVSKSSELWVFRRVRTGLPIPANCSTTCVACSKKHKLEILLPSWLPEETGRGIPS